jgi:bifunctional UDP-N-acetylglucosamine pyrophosphorylase/glucosamine-1-phosphate N-acetyltransferase
MALAIAILAAGKGTRMKSDLPKVLHTLGSKTLVERVLESLAGIPVDRCFVIVGHRAQLVRDRLAGAQVGSTPVEFVDQLEQLGTGHAVQQLLPHLVGFEGDLLVLNGDVPLLRPMTLQAMLDLHRGGDQGATILTACLADPTGYGRVFCNDRLSGDRLMVHEIIEHRDCSDAQRQQKRINAGIYCFRWDRLATILPNLRADNDQQEYYLTDAIKALAPAAAIDVADVSEIWGINDRAQLAAAYGVLQERSKRRWMQAGVTIIDPHSVTIDDTVELAPDAIIEPQTHLRGKTKVAAGARIGPGTLLENAQIGEGATVIYSVVADSAVGAGGRVGPYAHLRGGTALGDRCRIGNFVELKNAQIGANTNAAHLTYLGDAAIGDRCNFGAGTITANYDGYQKHRTTVGDRVKTGSNSVLVAPIAIGDDVTIGAGSVVTKDVAGDALVVARSKQVVYPGWRPKYLRDAASS